MEAILWLANDAFDGEGADIIVDDIGNYAEPYFEDGPVALAAADAVAGGAVFVSAAGNNSSRHYEADFLDGGDGYHAFDGDRDIALRIRGSFPGATLQWNDPFGASGNDYDLFVCPPGLKPVKFNLQNNVCRGSTGVQNGDDDPIEEAFLFERGEADIYIRKFSGDAKRLELFVQDGEILEHGVPEGGIIGHPAVAEVLAVGAIGASDPGNDDPDPFSDWGPSVLLNETRDKPDVMGIDGVTVSGVGGFGLPLAGINGSRFYGTSAAAPHVADIAALVMEAQRIADPTMTKKQVADAVTQTLRDTAIDLGDVGHDNTFGYGRADALSAVESITDFDLYSMDSFSVENHSGLHR